MKPKEIMKPKNGLPAIHPGEFLYEILEELGTSQAAFSRDKCIHTGNGIERNH